MNDDLGEPLKPAQSQASALKRWFFFFALAGFLVFSFWIGARFFFNAPQSPYVIVDVTREEAQPSPLATNQTPKTEAQQVTVVHGSRPNKPDDAATLTPAPPKTFENTPTLQKAPKIAVLVIDMGIGERSTQFALSLLPSEISLSFGPPDKPEITAFTREASKKGHEILVQLPMEPFDYPKSDPGPKTLLATASPTENLKRLSWLMSRFPHVSGATNNMGRKLYATPDALMPILSHLAQRNLLYIPNPDFKATNFEELAKKVGLRFVTPDLKINETTFLRIDASLLRAESVLKSKKQAVFIIAPAFPLTLQKLTAWLEKQKKKGAVLLPLSRYAYYVHAAEKSHTQGKE